ncbi:MAG: tRNA guanosine(34) transglycosylase Tgt [Dehalococcoidia bacterium]|nr:tRNA guanosine(34) transglycosylase Tgt [Dehalococcoidia bacterium]
MQEFLFLHQGFTFQILTSQSAARAGILHTPRGSIPTPAFLPVGTQAAVKSLTPEEVEALGAFMLLANAYHLYLRPGLEVIEALGGLHAYMSWQRPILTDSGGFQIFSLAHLVRTEDSGVTFRSHLDGSQHLITPEKAIEIQHRLGADIIMALDECAPYSATRDYHRQAMERTQRWVERCLSAHQDLRQNAASKGRALFGIVQGGTFPDLRRQSALDMADMEFDGYGIGGLSLGEPKEVTQAMVEETIACLPDGRPRHLLGVGSPEDLLEGIARGVDTFDSVLPTRIARNGALLTPDGRLNILNARFRMADGPIQKDCGCYTCRHFSLAYLHHLFRCQELLAYRLATIHNLWFTLDLMRRAREAILVGTFETFSKSFLARFPRTDPKIQQEQKNMWLKSVRRRAPLSDSVET